MIELKNVYFQYSDKDSVLEHVNITLPDTGLFILKGESGAGKTTLLKLLASILTPNSGKVLYNSEDINSHINKEKFMNLNCRYYEQNQTIINHLTVIEYIRISTFISNLHKIDSLLEKFKLSKLKDSVVSFLSGGEKARLQFLIVTINNPDIILLDEPFSSLDRESESLLYNEIISYSKNNLVILNTHRLNEQSSAEILEIKNKSIEFYRANKQTKKREERELGKFNFTDLIKKYLKNEKILWILSSFLISIVSFLSILMFSVNNTFSNLLNKEISNVLNSNLYSVNNNYDNIYLDDEDVNLLEQYDISLIKVYEDEFTFSGKFNDFSFDISSKLVLNEHYELAGSYQNALIVSPSTMMRLRMQWNDFTSSNEEIINSINHHLPIGISGKNRVKVITVDKIIVENLSLENYFVSRNENLVEELAYDLGAIKENSSKQVGLIKAPSSLDEIEELDYQILGDYYTFSSDYKLIVSSKNIINNSFISRLLGSNYCVYLENDIIGVSATGITLKAHPDIKLKCDPTLTNNSFYSDKNIVLDFINQEDNHYEIEEQNVLIHSKDFINRFLDNDDMIYETIYVISPDDLSSDIYKNYNVLNFFKEVQSVMHTSNSSVKMLLIVFILIIAISSILLAISIEYYHHFKKKIENKKLEILGYNKKTRSRLNLLYLLLRIGFSVGLTTIYLIAVNLFLPTLESGKIILTIDNVRREIDYLNSFNFSATNFFYAYLIIIVITIFSHVLVSKLCNRENNSNPH